MSVCHNSEKMIEALLKEIIGDTKQRDREILTRRFGLETNQRDTLEAIGDSYGITRERVRQIEAVAFASVCAKAKQSEPYQNFEKLAYAYLERTGGARQEMKFLDELRFVTNSNHHAAGSQIRFLLQLSPRLHLELETSHYYPFWVSDAPFARQLKKFLDTVERELRKRGSVLPVTDAVEFLSNAAAKAGISHFPTGALVEFSQISKKILVNPYGEWGLTEWSEIVPGGVRERAYYVLKQHQRPLHFRELAGLMNEQARLATQFHSSWQKVAEVQTVHNELIRGGHFVLVGRGTYGLREWGYQPGTVREVITVILKGAGRPLSKEEILQQVKARRLVKDATILINLQNTNVFERLGDGRYRTINKAQPRESANTENGVVRVKRRTASKGKDGVRATGQRSRKKPDSLTDATVREA